MIILPNELISRHVLFGETYASRTAEIRGIDNTPAPEMIPKLKRTCLEIVDPIIDRWGKDFKINSFYRCSELNTALGSRDTSNHVKGEAVDGEVSGVHNISFFLWCMQELPGVRPIAEFTKAMDGSAGWVHLDFGKNGNLYPLVYYKEDGRVKWEAYDETKFRWFKKYG